jgi:type IV fimbrial biogenesis protein FimT
MAAKKGFTLIEVLIIVAVSMIVVTVAAPGFAEVIRSNRLTSGANTFIGGLNLARSEAIKRNQRVTLRKTSTNWENGWEIFTDAPNAGGSYGIKDGADETLKVYAALADGYTLRGNNNFKNYISFEETGESNTMGSFALCDNSDNNNVPEPNTSRLIIVNAIGRVRVGIDSNGNGIPEKDDGSDFSSCLSP